MKKTNVAASLVAFAVALTACGPSSPPKCSGSDVEKVVLDIATEQMANAFFYRKTAVPLPDGTTLGNVDSTVKESYRQHARNALIEAKAVRWKLVGIRTNLEDEESLSSSCAATLMATHDNKTNELEITYDAQYSEDNMVYVNVQGL